MRLSTSLVLCLAALAGARSGDFDKESVSLTDFMNGKVPLLPAPGFEGRSFEFDDMTIIVAAQRCGIAISTDPHYSEDNFLGIYTLAKFVNDALMEGKCGEANYAYTALCANGEKDSINVKEPKKLIELLKVQLEANRQLTGKRIRLRSDFEELDQIYSKLYTSSLWSWANIYEWMAFLVTTFYGLVMFI
ncbi:hypothetical protein CJU89_5424 [Yarrowia sp. B02]|nr:hypothetical protein CJU89_5424 [Yarrowia sp. B02]